MILLTVVLPFLIILTVLVMIHELGHFIMALKFGMKVEEFGLGFPPRAWSFKRKGIVYSINWFPIGGFVKLYGEDGAGGGSITMAAGPGRGTGNIEGMEFVHWPAWKRFTVVVAGVVMNFVLAVVLISYLFSARGVALPTDNIKVVEVSKGSPAASAGIQKNDEVIELQGKKITDTNEFINVTHTKLGQPISLELKRNNHEFSVSVTPRKVSPRGEGPMGVAITNIEIRKYPWYTAPYYGTIEAFKFSWMILAGLGTMVADLVTKGQRPVGVAGPIGVAELTGQAVSYGVDATLWFVALLSLNLAVVNVLPIPALDGGRLFFILIELVTGRKVNAKYETMAHAIGLAVLLLLILFITFFDVARLIAGQPLIPKM